MWNQERQPPVIQSKPQTSPSRCGRPVQADLCTHVPLRNGSLVSHAHHCPQPCLAHPCDRSIHGQYSESKEISSDAGSQANFGSRVERDWSVALRNKVGKVIWIRFVLKERLPISRFAIHLRV